MRYLAIALLLIGCKDTVAPLVTPPPVPVAFRFLDAGSYHACGISTDEQLWCWGYNADGQLGIAQTVTTLSPSLIPGDFRYRIISGGQYHSCGATLAGIGYCWGNNQDGRLGSSGAAGSSSTVPVAVETPATFQSIQSGRVHSCGVDLAQHAWCWGYNGEGELGRAESFGPGSTDSPGTVAIATPIKAVTVGGLHTCATGVDGAAFCWGYNGLGQLGDGSTTTTSTPVPVAGGITFLSDPPIIFPSPDPDFPLPAGPFLAAGYDHTCGIGTTGSTYCWGLNQDGQLGDGTLTQRLTPTAISTAFVAVTAGLRHTCGLAANGAASCWGDNTFGQLGDGTREPKLVPTLVAGGIAFAYLKAGDLFTCGVTSGGEAYCWGDNEYGQLGTGNTAPSTIPVKVAAFLPGY